MEEDVIPPFSDHKQIRLFGRAPQLSRAAVGQQLALVHIADVLQACERGAGGLHSQAGYLLLLLTGQRIDARQRLREIGVVLQRAVQLNRHHLQLVEIYIVVHLRGGDGYLRVKGKG